MKKHYIHDKFMGGFRSWVVALFDMLCITICYFLALVIGRFGQIDAAVIIGWLKSLPIVLAINFFTFFFLRIFRSMWRYASGKDYIRLAAACVIAAVIYMPLDLLWLKFVDSFKVLIMTFAFEITVLTFSRVIYGSIYEKVKDSFKAKYCKRTMIVGGGYTAKALLEELTRSSSIYKPVCLVDDDVDKIGRTIYGIPVVGNTNEIPKFAKRYGIDSIIFAIPSINEAARKSILNNCLATECELKVLPYISEMVQNVDFLSQAHEVKIEDLLGRPPITFNNQRISEYIRDKVCLVTGGGGSIGSELCRQIVKFQPKRLIILDIYENSTYDVQQELLREYGDDLDLQVEIASVTDYDKMSEFFGEYHPQIVFHAAAHKHVPLMETNPEEAVKNNVFGTYNMASLSEKFGVEKFIMISTDKAVNPTNIMGATKRCCEMVVQYMAQKSRGTEFASVRFGNVLGSNGSVIPLFQKQIAKGGPVTVTHKDIIRYFMLIPEAVSLVLQAGAFAKGGEIFVLNMGEPVKILTLAENLIRMMGYKPYEDIKIEFTGLRPGEKLYEELLMAEEGLAKTENEKIFIGEQIHIDPEQFEKNLNRLKTIAMSNNKEKVVDTMKEIVPTFHPDKDKKKKKAL